MYPPLTALRAFEAASRCGSFSAAAEELSVTQSAVSHQVRHLEDWLGAPLFVRGKGNRLTLLPHGAALAQRLTASFGEIEAACRSARQAQDPPGLVIAAIPSVAVCWLIPRLDQFRRRHPDIRLRVMYALHGQAIDFSDVDLALIFSKEGAPRADGVRVTSFLPGSSTPVCSPSLAAELGKSGAYDFTKATLLHDSGVGGWQRWFARAQVPLPRAFEGPVFEDFNLLRAAALAGQGIALCAGAIIADDLRSERLVELSSVTVHDDCAYYLLDHQNRGSANREAAEAFREWLFASREQDARMREAALDARDAYVAEQDQVPHQV